MTETIQQQQMTVDGLPVDTGTKYPLDAGRCESCGQYKTWKFKIQNKKTGKMMPGHVTVEGFRIGDGECPKWAKIAESNMKRAERKSISGATSLPPPQPGEWIHDITGAAPAASGPSMVMPTGKPTGTLERVALARARVPGSCPQPGFMVAFMVNGITITTTVGEALTVIEQISAAVRKILGRGA